MNKLFQNYSKQYRSVLMTDAGFAIVSAFDVKPTGMKAGLAESIFWNNFVNNNNRAVSACPCILRQAQDDNCGGRQLGKE